MKRGEQYIHIQQGFQCDSTFFRVFDADLIAGNPENVLDGPGSMVITESLAKRAFGSNNPVGQILTLPAGQYYGEESDFVIKGIMKDFPQNSHFHPEFITTPIQRSALEFWAWTYVLLKEKAEPGSIISGSKDFFVSHYQADPEEFDISAHLQKITDIHLHPFSTWNSSEGVIFQNVFQIMMAPGSIL